METFWAFPQPFHPLLPSRRSPIFLAPSIRSSTSSTHHRADYGPTINRRQPPRRPESRVPSRLRLTGDLIDKEIIGFLFFILFFVLFAGLCVVLCVALQPLGPPIHLGVLSSPSRSFGWKV